MMTKDNCKGCRDDFYNGHNPLGVKECWLFKKAKLVARYRTHRDAMPASKGAFTEVVVPDCYHAPPLYFVKEVPDFVRAEDIIRSPR